MEGRLVCNRPLLGVLGAAVALAGAGCGGSGSSSSTSATSTTKSSAGSAVEISSRTLPGLGAVLVNGQGRTLYIFVPDRAKKVTCTGGCASIWPQVLLPGAAKPVASGAVKPSLLGSDPNPGGGRVLTYGGWPLYNYVADPTSGTASGEGVSSSGGLWYVIAPSGTVIKHNS
jgi:predicted lipoprotein with Yx(FWY)xxD motif